MAHRFAYAIVNGPIPLGMSVCHTCDNPSCCNPSHLFLGTAADNNRDMVYKGRNMPPPHPTGVDHPRAKLSTMDVFRIRRDCANGASQRATAMRYGVSQSTVSKAVLLRVAVGVGVGVAVVVAVAVAVGVAVVVAVGVGVAAAVAVVVAVGVGVAVGVAGGLLGITRRPPSCRARLRGVRLVCVPGISRCEETACD